MPNDRLPWPPFTSRRSPAHDLRAVLRLASGRDARTLHSSPESRARAGYDGALREKDFELHMAVNRIHLTE
ncbi:hypothetical protein [Microvirga calopogonii]|uniref:hypothetical protein n=1 Tax=Microvirga calopogonii TaxID=2078013 RepID=UPI000E0DF1BC